MLDITNPVSSIQFSWIQSANCNPCSKSEHQYDQQASITYQNHSSRFSGSGGLIQVASYCRFEGDFSSDVIELGKSELSAELNFTLVDKSEECEFLPVDGELGLASDSFINVVPFIVQLKETGAVSDAVFAIFISKSTENNVFPASTLEIGSFNVNKFSSRPDDLFFMEYLHSTLSRAVVFDSSSFGDWPNPYDVLVCFSSTVPYILGDLNAYFDIFPYLTEIGLDCEFTFDGFVITCVENSKVELPGLKFNSGPHVIELPAPVIWKCSEGICTSLIQFSVSGYWKLGQVFLKEYFTVFDYERRSIGFAPAAVGRVLESESTGH